MTNEEAYKRIENIVYMYEEKELSLLADRVLDSEALHLIRKALENELRRDEYDFL